MTRGYKSRKWCIYVVQFYSLLPLFGFLACAAADLTNKQPI